MDEMDKEASERLVELADELGELHGAATQLESPLLGDLVQRLEAWLNEASQRGADVKATLDRVAGDVESLLKKIDEVEADKSKVEKPAPVSTMDMDRLEKEAAEAKVLKVRCEALQRKCELLTTLESDGRLENGELHKVRQARDLTRTIPSTKSPTLTIEPFLRLPPAGFPHPYRPSMKS
jgi:hypothetical protein